MTINQIMRIARQRAEHNVDIVVVPLGVEHQTIEGACTFAGTNKFRVDTPQAAIFFKYTEVEAVA